MYDPTLALIRIRGLMDKINEMMADPNGNVLYFVTGEYASDSYRLVTLFGELDKALTLNDDAERLPLWWRIDPLSLGVVQTGQQKVSSAVDPPRMAAPPSNPAGLSLQCSECGEWDGHFGSCSRKR